MRHVSDAPSISPATSEVATAAGMAAYLAAARPASGAEGLRMLRLAFPHSTLGERVAAMARWIE